MSLLAITRETSEIRLEGEHLTVRDCNGESCDVPLCEITEAVICGRPRLSLPVLLALLERGVRIVFLSSGGRWLGGMGGDPEDRAKRLHRQVRLLDDPDAVLSFARRLASAKLRNQRRVIARLAARRGRLDECRPVLNHLADLARLAGRANDPETIRGLEGTAAADYFRSLNVFLPESFRFETRSRRPPRDPANALFSFCYSVTAGELDGLLRRHGLEPLLGFLHRSSERYPALAWDLLEIFRAPFCDMLCLHLLNRKILRREHFESCSETNGVRMSPEGRRLFFRAYEEKKHRLFRLPGDPVRTSYARQFEQQVLLVAAWVDGRTADDFFRMP